MKIIALEQNTPAWHEYRNTRIGASDFALFACHKGLSKPIFRIDFYGSIYNKRNNIELKSNIFMERGHVREPILRDYYTSKYNVICEPIVCEFEDDGQIFASLDGYNPFDNAGLEIKTTSAKCIKSNNDNDIPIWYITLEEKMQYYIYQLVHQMYAGDLNYIDVVFEFKDDEIVDKRYYKEDLPISIHEWRELCFEYLLELNGDKDNYDTILLLNQYYNLDREIKELEDNKQNMFNNIKSLNIEGVHGDFIVKLTKNNSLRITKKEE